MLSSGSTLNLPLRFTHAPEGNFGSRRRSRTQLGHAPPRQLPPMSNLTYPLPDPRRITGQRLSSTGELPSIAAPGQFSMLSARSKMQSSELGMRPRSSFPYRHSPPSAVSIEIGHQLSAAVNAPAKRNASRHVVLYTHDSPFTVKGKIVKKMTAADFEQLASKTGYPATELLKFHKFFNKLVHNGQAGSSKLKGVDEKGLAMFLGRFGNIDPTDDCVCKRLFEINCVRGNPTLSFEQAMAILQLIKPPGRRMERDVPLCDAPGTIAKVHLFFDIVDTNQSGQLCLREIQVITRISNADRFNVAKERRKMMVDKVMQDVYDALSKQRTDYITREELLHAVGTSPDIQRFFLKGLFMSANVNS